MPTVIYDAATQIFAQIMGSGKVTHENQKSAMQTVINMAVELAIETDRMVDQNSGERGHFAMKNL